MSTTQKDPEQNETRFLRQFVDVTGKRVLEIGCGEGRLTWRYAASSLSTVGVDPDTDALRVAIYDRPVDLANKVQFTSAKAEQLPFHKETFDIAILAWSL